MVGMYPKDYEKQVADVRRWVPEWECEVWEGDEARKKVSVLILE